jgi:hypothetical protein
LNASILTWMVCADCSFTALISERSALTNPGPTSVLRPRLPRVPGAGSANALIYQ